MTRGVHRRTDATDPFLADLRGWAQVLPPAGRFTHLTAATLHGLWLPPLPPGIPVFAAIPQEQGRPVRPGLTVLRPSRLEPAVLVAGVEVDPPERTLLTLARHLSELDLTVLVDSALHAGLTDVAGLARCATGRQRGAPRLRRVLAWVDGRSESAWETMLRRLHELCGVRVEPQVEVRDDDGTFVARGDLRLVGTRVLHEYDGGHHLEVSRQQADLRRARGLVRAGWIRRGYTAGDLLHRASGVLRDADDSLGRPHDPARVAAWHEQLRASCFTPAGRFALLGRLGLATDRTQR
ncbi:hypothetical protein [Nocardioides campestrisoli]|uniref:hypothetical protein n=1 Tax=Nocardioides campestrisoli TaxID=2736757 RepID=UPI00174996C2|nr:hypothetical protein [Nocardioides campestrisoli]